MKLTEVALLFFSLTVTGAVAQSEPDYNVPKNEWGDPDLSGVWNFASNTPMQRPEKWGEQEFLTSEQLQEEIIRQQAAARAADDRAARTVDLNADIPTGPQVLGYNDFWLETQGLGANVRTSHIV